MKKITATFVLFVLVVLSGCGFKENKVTYAVDLVVWGAFDNSAMLKPSLDEYAKLNPYIKTVSYQKYTLDTYKTDLLNALAAGNGPDVFMINSAWLPDFQDKIVPVPENLMTEAAFRENFVDVVADDMIVDGKIYGVPLSVDSLGLYYNKDIFNAAGITQPPRTWAEFDQIVKTLTRVDDSGTVVQSAAAIGTAYNTDGTYNVNRASDIVTALMMQGGADMSQADGDEIHITFDQPARGTGRSPGQEALQYYTDFASASSPMYTWNKRQHYSIDAFYQGTAAMMLNYSYHYDTIKAKNAKLRFAVADLPQITQDSPTKANMANYWVMVVAKNKNIPEATEGIQLTQEMRAWEAWQFLKAMTFPSAEGITLADALGGEALIYTPAFDLTERYLEESGKPAARRDIIAKQKDDVRLGAFARGNLIAKSWKRHGADDIDVLFNKMIDQVNIGEMSVQGALDLCAKRAVQLQK